MLGLFPVLGLTSFPKTNIGETKVAVVMVRKHTTYPRNEGKQSRRLQEISKAQNPNFNLGFGVYTHDHKPTV